MPYQLPFGGLSTLIALAIRSAKWLGGILVVIGVTIYLFLKKRIKKTE